MEWPPPQLDKLLLVIKGWEAGNYETNREHVDAIDDAWALITEHSKSRSGCEFWIYSALAEGAESRDLIACGRLTTTP